MNAAGPNGGKLAVIDYLIENGAIYVDQHFVYTSGKHGPQYIDPRAIAHHTDFLEDVAEELSLLIAGYEFDYILGPETLGRTFGYAVATWLRPARAIWCNFEGEGENKKALFISKFNFGRLITPGTRVLVVDELLTTGSSIRQVVELIESLGGIVVAAVVVVRRDLAVTAETCNVPILHVLAEAPPGFVSYTEAECQAIGPCSTREPMVRWPGHGDGWLKKHTNYPAAS